MAGMSIWGPVISLVLVTSPDGFPRQPDTTQGIHAFRANPGVALQSTQWVANSSVQQVVETEFEVRQSKHDRLHLFRQSFQTVGQPWALWPKASNRVEAETFGQPAPNYSLFFGRASQTQPTQPWSAYKWTSPVHDIQEYRPQWTDHNAAYAPFQTRAGLIANQPWNAYRWQIQTPDTAPYVEYRSRDFWADYLPFTLTPLVPVAAEVATTTGSVPGFVPGKKKKHGPVMRAGQVFGEEYPISPLLDSKAVQVHTATELKKGSPIIDESIHHAVTLLMKHLL